MSRHHDCFIEPYQREPQGASKPNHPLYDQLMERYRSRISGAYRYCEDGNTRLVVKRGGEDLFIVLLPLIGDFDYSTAQDYAYGALHHVCEVPNS